MQLKFVVAGQDDYDFLKGRLSGYILNGLNIKCPVILQPEGMQLSGGFNYQMYATRLKMLHERVADDWQFWKYYAVRIMPQLHKIIWQKDRGV